MTIHRQSHRLLCRFLGGLCFIALSSLSNALAQRYEGSYSPPPDYVIAGGPIAGGGLTTYRADGVSGYTIHSEPAYSAGFVVAFLHMRTAREFYAVPILGLQYHSRAVSFVGAQNSGATLRVNSCDLSLGLVFPFVQALLGVDVPLGGSSAKGIESDIERVVTIHPSAFNITIEPRVVLYYPIPSNSDKWDAVAPFLSVGIPLTNLIRHNFDPASQTFGSSANGVSGIRMSSIQIGLAYGFEWIRHYSGPPLID
jgi:hypothetical protein